MADLVLQALSLWILLVEEFDNMIGGQGLSSEAVGHLVIKEISRPS